MRCKVHCICVDDDIFYGNCCRILTISLMRNPSGGSLEAAVAAISTGIYSKGERGGRVNDTLQITQNTLVIVIRDFVGMA